MDTTKPAPRIAMASRAPQSVANLLERFDVIEWTTDASFAAAGSASFARTMEPDTEFEIHQLAVTANFDTRALALQLIDGNRSQGYFSEPLPANLFADADYGLPFTLPAFATIRRGGSLKVELTQYPGAVLPNNAAVTVSVMGVANRGDTRGVVVGPRPAGELYAMGLTVRGTSGAPGVYLKATGRVPSDTQLVVTQVAAMFDHSNSGASRYDVTGRTVQLRAGTNRDNLYPTPQSLRHLAAPIQRQHAHARPFVLPANGVVLVEYYPTDPAAVVNGQVVLFGHRLPVAG